MESSDQTELVGSLIWAFALYACQFYMKTCCRIAAAFCKYMNKQTKQKNVVVFFSGKIAVVVGVCALGLGMGCLQYEYLFLLDEFCIS